jgi:protocatechuate 3,4-dioxygenase beta subunit
MVVAGGLALVLVLVFVNMRSETARANRERQSAPAPEGTDGDRVPDAAPAGAPGESGRDVGQDHAAPLTGRVIDLDTGRGVGGAAVIAVPASGGAPRTVTADREGAFRLEGLEGRHRLDAAATGYASARLVATWTKRSLENEPGSDALLELQRAAIVRGRVVDPSGRGLPGARIRATMLTRRTGGGVTVATLPAARGLAAVADENGQFELDGVAPLGKTHFSVEHEGYRSGWFEFVAEAVPPPEEAVVTLEPVAEVKGRVSGADGRPLPGAAVMPVRFDPSFGRGARHAGEDGTFAFPLDERWTHVLVWAEGHLPAFAAARTDETVDVRLRAAAEVRGVVRDDLGQAVPGARVRVHHYITDRDGERGKLASAFVTEIEYGDDMKWALLPHDESGRMPVPETRSDEVGRFALRAGGRGEMETVLLIDEPAHVEALVSWTEGARDLVVDLVRSARLLVVAVDARTAEPLAEYSMSVEVSRGRRRTVKGQHKEPAEIRLAPGDYVIKLEAPGYVAREESVAALRPAEERTLRVALDR